MGTDLMGIPYNSALDFITRLSRHPPTDRLEAAIHRLFFKAGRRSNPVVVSMNGRRLQVFHRCTFSDLFVMWQCFYKQQYEVPTPELHSPVHKLALENRYAEILSRKQRPLIIDCGANIGTSTLWFHARYPEARIIAIEPAPDNASVLRQNCANTDIDVVEGGVAAVDGVMSIVDPDGSTNGYRTTPVSDREQAVGREVTALSLATILARASAAQCEPFILKVDIEGSEKTFFAVDWTNFDRFPLIIVEQHDFMMPGQSTGDSFFRYHASRQRDFLYGVENIFSVDYKALAPTGFKPR
jgi:FkbM family methyltransferase